MSSDDDDFILILNPSFGLVCKWEQVVSLMENQWDCNTLKSNIPNSDPGQQPGSIQEPEPTCKSIISYYI